MGKAAHHRSKGFTDDEADSILTAALNLKQGGDTDKTFADKRWIPWLFMFTGARVGEPAKLCRQDVLKMGEHHVIRITPEAGPVKTNEAREVPLHTQIVELASSITFTRSLEASKLLAMPIAAKINLVPISFRQ